MPHDHAIHSLYQCMAQLRNHNRAGHFQVIAVVVFVFLIDSLHRDQRLEIRDLFLASDEYGDRKISIKLLISNH
jgi:hypothetical protein